jgi:hypothetical protein
MDSSCIRMLDSFLHRVHSHIDSTCDIPHHIPAPAPILLEPWKRPSIAKKSKKNAFFILLLYNTNVSFCGQIFILYIAIRNFFCQYFYLFFDALINCIKRLTQGTAILVDR